MTTILAFVSKPIAVVKNQFMSGHWILLFQTLFPLRKLLCYNRLLLLLVMSFAPREKFIQKGGVKTFVDIRSSVPPSDMIGRYSNYLFVSNSIREPAKSIMFTGQCRPLKRSISSNSKLAAGQNIQLHGNWKLLLSPDRIGFHHYHTRKALLKEAYIIRLSPLSKDKIDPLYRKTRRIRCAPRLWRKKRKSNCFPHSRIKIFSIFGSWSTVHNIKRNN